MAAGNPVTQNTPTTIRNLNGDPGITIYVSDDDPSVGHGVTLLVGDLWVDPTP